MNKNAVAFLVLALVNNGCAPMAVGPPVVTDVPRETIERPTANGTLEATFDGSDGDTTVQLWTRCDVNRVQAIDRTTIRQYENKAPNYDFWAGALGLVLTGAGTLNVIHPQTAATDELSAKQVRGTGYALIGAGALLLAVPVIDYFREHRTADEKTERVEVSGPVVARDVRCGHPVVDTELFAHSDSGPEQRLGQSDPGGVVRFNLDATIPAAWTKRRDSSVRFVALGQTIGSLSLASLRATRETRTWAAVATSSCTAASDERECSAQYAYLAAFSDGAHATEAQEAIEGARQRRLEAAEEASWNQLDLRACQTPTKRDSREVTGACLPLANHLLAYPSGKRASDVRQALSKGRELIAQLDAAEQQRAAQLERTRHIPPATATPPGAFIPYAGNGRGPTPCRDGTWSHSAGRGTCSHHGGVAH